jgi:structural maintenance of chromosome 4
LLTVKDEKYRQVFYNVLRDTIVTDNIDIAKEIAFKSKIRRRVVTLDGKLIEPTGLMCGGPIARKGGMSSKFREELS